MRLTSLANKPGISVSYGEILSHVHGKYVVRNPEVHVSGLVESKCILADGVEATVTVIILKAMSVELSVWHT